MNNDAYDAQSPACSHMHVCTHVCVCITVVTTTKKSPVFKELDKKIKLQKFYLNIIEYSIFVYVLNLHHLKTWHSIL